VAETVVGATTGVVPPPKGYFKGAAESRFFKFGRIADHESAMKSVCDKYGALLILDEVRPIYLSHCDNVVNNAE
jgi:E3 ubiquitin-protein ligase TRIP12